MAKTKQTMRSFNQDPRVAQQMAAKHQEIWEHCENKAIWLAHGTSTIFDKIYGDNVERTMTISENSSSLLVAESMNHYQPPPYS